MAMAMLRFNLILPGLEPQRLSDMHKAALDMAALADEQGFAVVSLEEHHGAENGWSPSPLVFAGLVFGRTQRIGVTISALLLPLHDPLRVAEDIAVLDLASGGRLTTIVGLGYRPSEYAAHGKDWSRRGRLMDEAVQALLDAWTGEPFEYRGTVVRVTPKPLTQPHPMLLLGGTSVAAAKRAARFGLPYFPAAHLPEREALYYEECAAHGTTGFCMMPSPETVMLHVADDPDRAWAELGDYFLHEASTYAGWQTPDITSAVHSHAHTVEELRAEGIYQVLTPDECVDRARTQGAAAAFCLHPLCGGMPIDRAWESVQLFTDKVWPQVNAAA
jgi:alkanesulfonate monooxygenase SsuD/methylene tetrahydromethanopterin reductase-like flavin-dependent oxidoreductase (luciferase family)